MRCRLLLLCFASLLLASGRAQTSASSGTAPRAAVRSGAKGPLPDPVLLDGSTQPAEKHPDYGMLGDFEMPGDENAKGGNVGGQQNPNQSGGGGGQQQNQSQQGQQGGGGQMAGLPQGGGGSQGQQSANQGAQQGGGGAAGGDQQANQNGQGAGGSQGGAQGGDPNGKAEGIQVAGLEGDAASGQSGGGGAPGDNVPKPQQVAIGDSSMQIKSEANSSGVVGQVAAGSTQQMESKIGKGSGGGAGTTSPSNTGRGVEKGRTMPAGL